MQRIADIVRMFALIAQATLVRRIFTHIGELAEPPPDLVPDWEVLAQPSPKCVRAQEVVAASRRSPVGSLFAIAELGPLMLDSQNRGRSTVVFPRSGRQGCESWSVKVPLPSIARFVRLAYPLLGAVTNRDRHGRRSLGCPAYVSAYPSNRSGREGLAMITWLLTGRQPD